LQTKNQIAINDAVIDFKNGFKSNRLGINNLIFADMTNFKPIDKTTYSLAAEHGKGLATFPCLVIIFENIADNNIRKSLIKSFIQNNGNINLKSSRSMENALGNVNALSDAIKLHDRKLIQFLLENGADPNILNQEQTALLNSIMATPAITVKSVVEEPVVTASIIEKPVVIEESHNIEKPVVIEETSVIEAPIIEEHVTPKLIIPTELSPRSTYDPSIEPEFWVPLFGSGNMFSLREKIHSMMIRDTQIPIENNKISEIWSVCQIIQALIPTYYVPTEFKQTIPDVTYIGHINIESPIHFTQYNIALCAALLVFGIISHKMKEQDYKIIFKGGKAIQLVLGEIQNSSIYESEDIDVLIMPNKDIEYNETNVKNLSGHIAYLINWFLTITTPVSIYISVLWPNPSNPRSNHFIFKLSYIKGYMDFKAISDIDFKEIPERIKPFFERSVDYQFEISELNEKVSFRCPDIGSLLDEKIYYYTQFSIFKDLLLRRQPITEPGYETLNIVECDRLLNKFKKAIISLNRGLQMNRFPTRNPTFWDEKEISFLLTRLDRFIPMFISNKRIQKNIQTMIVEDLYPGKVRA
jgi:hypothetical protein